MNKLSFLAKTIKEAGELLLDLRKKEFSIYIKGEDPKDIVTSVDKKIEKFLINKINNNFPEHSIYSEEGMGKEKSSDLMWVIDPIDGTANFSRGIPHFAVCIGLLKDGVPILGTVYNPVTKELFSFEKGKGAFLNKEEIKVSSITDLKGAHVFLHAGRKEEMREWGGESYKKLLRGAKKTSNLAGSALDACFVAAGRIEASIYGTLSTLDIASAIGILDEAGGFTVDNNGNFPKLDSKPQKIYMANNQKILKSIRELV